MVHITTTWLDAEKSRVHFELPAQTEWDAEGITRLIQALAQVRQAMTPEVSWDTPVLQKQRAVADPLWWTLPEQPHGGSFLLLRHPALGWLTFLLPIHERRRVADLWREQDKHLAKRLSVY